MATVYLAQDVRHDRKVALKVLRPELAAVIGAERFLAEIKTTANLQHPHILPLFDSGEADGFVFYVMPFVEGESLRDRLNREKQLPVDDAVRIAREVAGALDYAHRHGVIHRDIKPENILLHDGRALVADFGIALAASSAGGTRMTETGMSLGTPHYMSPEQAMGEREITARADIYALGARAVRDADRRAAVHGPTAQAIVARVMTEEPPPHAAAAPHDPAARGGGGAHGAGEAAGRPVRDGGAVRRGAAGATAGGGSGAGAGRRPGPLPFACILGFWFRAGLLRGAGWGGGGVGAGGGGGRPARAGPRPGGVSSIPQATAARSPREGGPGPPRSRPTDRRWCIRSVSREEGPSSICGGWTSSRVTRFRARPTAARRCFRLTGAGSSSRTTLART